MASTYLERTVSAGNQQIFTYSTWVKFSNPSATDNALFGDDGGYPNFFVNKNSTQQLRIGATASDTSTIYELITTQVFRDPSAWYHIVLAVDTTQATSSDRVKLYVNGEQVTSFSTETYPSQNANICIGASGNAFRIGQFSGVWFFEGSMSHVHFIDGTAYDASAFGEYDANGVWKAKTSPSVTYGTNGFFILKDSASVTDQSGNGNNFTVAGGTLTDTLDCSANVFATWNPLDKSISGTAPTFSNGNLTWTSSGAGVGNNNAVRGTLGASSGKWYWEAKWVQNVTLWGMQDADAGDRWNSNGYWFPQTGSYGVDSSGTKTVNGTTSASFSALSANDIVGFAFDLDNSKFYVSVNGTFVNSGDPTSGATGTGSLGDIITGKFYVPIVGNGDYGSSSISHFNFGNGYFGTTAVASAGTNASGNGIFEYDVPTGYTAFSTKGLNL